jgi:transposase-like protein
MPYRCRGCRKRFSVKTGTVMQCSKLGLQTWALAGYIMTTNLKGSASMKLHRDLGITQKTAWHLAHRIRETWAREAGLFGGPVEADETWIGGKRKNMPRSKRRKLTGRGTAGKTAVAGVKDRATGRVSARRMAATDTTALQRFVRDTVAPGATLYTDEAAAYRGMPEYAHQAVNHSAGEYVRDMAHTNGIESFWAMLKRGYMGTFHKFSEKHLDRYIAEFAGRHNIRPRDTIDMMRSVVIGMAGKRLRYRDLIADNGLPSGARS